jgi:hypothetical protein
MAPDPPEEYPPTTVGMVGSTGGRRRTSSAAPDAPIGKVAIARLGTGTNGLSRSFGAEGRCSAVVAGAVGLLAAGIGLGASDAANVSRGDADSGLEAGKAMGCTAGVAAEGCVGSTAAGVERGVAGGAAAVFVVGGPVGAVICQTIG